LYLNLTLVAATDKCLRRYTSKLLVLALKRRFHRRGLKKKTGIARCLNTVNGLRTTSMT